MSNVWSSVPIHPILTHSCPPQLFPRGGKSKPILFDGPNRSASAFYYWALRNIPHKVKKIYHLEDLPAWIEEVSLLGSHSSMSVRTDGSRRTRTFPALFS